MVPFLADSIVTNLFASLGKGHWIFVAGVSRQWFSLYEKEAKDKRGKLRRFTKWSAAKASISTLEYACACGLDLADDAPDLCRGGFDPAIYAWAREHGYPLVVWVATNVYEDVMNKCGEVSAVSSSLKAAQDAAIKEAKQKYISEYGREPDLGEAPKWFEYGRVSELDLERVCDANLKVEAVAVKDVTYAKELELHGRLPMYVITRAVQSDDFEFYVDGVYTTKEATDRKFEEGMANARADSDHVEKVTLATRDRDGARAYEVLYYQGIAYVTVEWGKCLSEE